MQLRVVDQFWFDIGVDLLTIGCFGVAVWQMLTVAETQFVCASGIVATIPIKAAIEMREPISPDCFRYVHKRKPRRSGVWVSAARN